MKAKVTKKEIRNNYNNIIAIPYCEATYLLRDLSPNFYSYGIYGWCCDYYEIGNVIISTGYSPIGDYADMKFLHELENEATALWGAAIKYNDLLDKLIELRQKLINHELNKKK